MSELSTIKTAAGVEAGRAQWRKPELRRIHAGSAEAGANPINPEGLFSGS